MSITVYTWVYALCGFRNAIQFAKLQVSALQIWDLQRDVPCFLGGSMQASYEFASMMHNWIIPSSASPRRCACMCMHARSALWCSALSGTSEGLSKVLALGLQAWSTLCSA